ncbi:Uncharacterized protein dnm_066840 [Desulfonema magnum]|uniref:Uncharacterized protein n=1 Tax=Desulfonema magnum TaxID=45655 RepID=A0A975BS63_9BACT|nr:Uncharacterized protein dnm_066840 [Desulfonema magnum]
MHRFFNPRNPRNPYNPWFRGHLHGLAISRDFMQQRPESLLIPNPCSEMAVIRGSKFFHPVNHGSDS